MSLRLTLYVAGDTPRSMQAIANFRHICTELLGGQAESSVVDVLADPDGAEAARILTTPTLIRESPLPPRRVTGDLGDVQKVLLVLGLENRSSYPIEGS